MNREELDQIRDRLIYLSECSVANIPQNIKRKSSSSIKSRSKDGSKEGPKWSMQDFVRRDPSYTTDIEHLVFPGRRRTSQSGSATSSKTRSRLAEMFALSRHLQQRSVERELKIRNPLINRSVDSAMESSRSLPQKQKSSSVVAARLADQGLPAAPSSSIIRQRSTYDKQSLQPVRQDSFSAGFIGASRPSASAAEVEMSTARGPNISIIHLRSPPRDSWDPLSKSSSNKSQKSFKSVNQNLPSATKHSSSSVKYPWEQDENVLRYEEPSISKAVFISGSCSRELSPVRWCDREVDGVYLGRSGWVQVHQRSLDDSRKTNLKQSNFSGSFQQPRKNAIKLADYHCNSEPGKLPGKQRPVYLPVGIQRTNTSIERSPPSSPPFSPTSVQDSPPSITPIISPPPAFQDKKDKISKSRSFFTKPPFLPRYDAIDRDILTPPESPLKAKPPTPQPRKTKSLNKDVSKARMPQTKSLEDTSSDRRSNFVKKYGSSSSSSSSMGFRSLDSCLSRPTMPKLNERRSFDTNEDADEEDNNSSSANFNVKTLSSVSFNSSTESVRNRSNKSAIGKSSKTSIHLKPQLKRSPVSSDTAKQHSSRSSSSSSNESRLKSPSNASTQSKRSPNSRQNNTLSTDEIKVRRSKSLQLPDHRSSSKSPERPSFARVSPVKSDRHQVLRKPVASLDKFRKHGHSSSKSLDIGMTTDRELVREAELVTDYVSSTRSKSAAQALVWQRYNKIKEDRASANKKGSNSFDVYYVGKNGRDKRKILERGITTPSISRESFTPKFKVSDGIIQCPKSCEFWPHCSHRENWVAKQQMRPSQSYPSHQYSLGRSPDRGNSNVMDKIDIDKYSRSSRCYSRRGNKIINDTSPEFFYRRNPYRISPGSFEEKNRDMSEEHIYEKISPRISPANSKSRSPSGGRDECSSDSSSYSEMWLTPSDRTRSKSSRTAKSSSGSTPLGNLSAKDYNDLSRPGSAPTQDNYACFEEDQRSMSLPKSFLSVNYQHGSEIHV